MVELLPVGREALHPRRNRWRVTSLRLLLGLLAIVFAIWLILFITKGRFLKSPFENLVSKFSERQVSVGGDFQLYFAPFDIKFLAEDMRVSNPKWASQPSLRCDQS